MMLRLFHTSNRHWRSISSSLRMIAQGMSQQEPLGCLKRDDCSRCFTRCRHLVLQKFSL